LADATLFVCPDQCYVHSDLDNEKNWNGIWLQLYALRSDKNWGIGDLGDLVRLARQAATGGVKILGLSPLHTPFFMMPEARSPYSPSSRLYKNPVYIDI